MLESLRDIPKNNYKLVIYTGQMHNKICFLADKIDLNYSLHPLVPQKDIEKITAEADILLSVGNKDSDFLPSKILSYIATGKPIIHYYFDESDVSLPYLKKYNNSLLICMSELHDEVTKKIKEFIDTASTLQMSFSQIASAFAENTPKYTSQELYQIIGELN
jgi:thiamine pyrophosphate-dependent acetolactate synthase large subunit-like protein